MSSIGSNWKSGDALFMLNLMIFWWGINYLKMDYLEVKERQLWQTTLTHTKSCFTRFCNDIFFYIRIFYSNKPYYQVAWGQLAQKLSRVFRVYIEFKETRRGKAPGISLFDNLSLTSGPLVVCERFHFGGSWWRLVWLWFVSRSGFVAMATASITARTIPIAHSTSIYFSSGVNSAVTTRLLEEKWSLVYTVS